MKHNYSIFIRILGSETTNSLKNTYVYLIDLVIVLLELIKVNIIGIVVSVLKVLSKKKHGGGANGRFVTCGKRQMKTGHWFKKIHNRALTRRHDDSEVRIKSFRNRSLLLVNSLRRGAAHDAIVVRNRIFKIINDFKKIHGNRATRMFCCLQRADFALMIFKPCPVRQ